MSPRPPLVLEPAALLASLLSAAVAAAVGMHLFFLFGIVPAVELLAVGLLGGLRGLGRFPPRFLSDELLLLAQTAAAAAGVAAALSLVLPISLATAAGLPSLVTPLLLGATLFSATALLTLTWLFRSSSASASVPCFPAPDLPVASTAVERRLRLVCLALGLATGFWAGLPFAAPLAAAFGLAFLGSGLGVGALAAGLLARPTLPYLGSLGLATQDLPAGALLGAALIALPQITLLALARWARARRLMPATPVAEAFGGFRAAVRSWLRWPKSLLLAPLGWLARFTLALGLCLAVGMLAVLAADLGPLELSPGRNVGLALLVGLSNFAFQLWSALVAAWTGLVPLLGGALLVLLFGAALRLEPSSLVLLVALATAGGAMLGALGAQLRAGLGIPGSSLRGQQVLAGLLGLAVALAVVVAGYRPYLEAGYLPPAATALAAALAVSQGSLPLAALLPGFGLGALLQLLGGPATQLGLLFSTGLLLDLEPAGWALLWGLLARTLAALVTRGRAEAPLAIFGLGCIAGEFLRLLAGLF